MGIGTLMILGGALQGAGGGIARQAEMDRQQAQEMEKISASQRFQETMENLRAKNNREAQNDQYDLADRNSARDTVRKTAQQIAVDNNQTKNQSDYARLQHRLGVQMKAIDFNNDAALARLRSALDLASDKERARFNDGLQRDDYAGTFEDENNVVHILYRDGTVQKTGIKAAATERTAGSAGSTSIANARAERGGGQPPKATPAPAAKGTMRNGYPVARNDAEAEAIVSNPANKGKKFYTPEGELVVIK